MTTDGLGLLQLPAPNTDTPLGDPLLDVLLGFWKQCLINALTSVWASACPNVPVVKTTDARNIQELGLTTAELPGLFVARDGSGETTWRASDYALIPTKLLVWWAMPRLELSNRRKRAPIVNAARAALEFPTEWVGRTPGWIVAGDTDPRAATLGSLLPKYAGLWYLHWKRSEIVRVPVNMPGEAKQTVEAILWTLEIGERLTIDPNNAARTYPLAGLKDSVSDGDSTGAAGKLLVNVEAKLRVASITPATGSHLGGTAVTVIGTQFLPAATLTIGGNLCLDAVVSADGTLITATTPAHAAGAVDVVVTNSTNDAVTLTGAFTYT